MKAGAAGAGADTEFVDEDGPCRRTLLAPRFQFTDLDIRSAVENSLVAVVTGSSPEQTAEAAQAIIDEKRGG